MATITTLKKDTYQDDLTVKGQVISGTERWNLVTSAKTDRLGAIALLEALGSGNAYGWRRIGIDATATNSAVYSTGYSLGREDELTTKFKINVTITNEINKVNQARRAVDAPAYYDYQNVDVVKEVDVDPIANEAIAASNGEAYFPRVTKKGTLKRIVVDRNETFYDPDRADAYEGFLNLNAMKINGRLYPARSILLESWTGKNEFDVDGSEYYKVRYEFLTDRLDLHKIELIDAASGEDKAGRWPQVRGAENRPYKLGRTAEGDGEYMTKADQQDPTKYYTKEFNIHGEIDMRFLRV